jgi:hypothetical protein
MKKFTLLLALMAILPAMFATPFSELTITINENAGFYAVIDGRQYDSRGGSVYISNLSHGNHSLEVVKSSLTLNGTMYDYLYRGSVNILPNKRIFATIDRFGTFVILRTENLHENNGHGNGYGHHGGPGNGYGNNGYYSDNNGYYGSGSYGCSGSNGYFTGNSYNTGGYGCYGMSPESFSMLLASMRRESFDDTRVHMALSAVSRGVTSAQLRELMLMLTFDSNRLRLAKGAYNFVIDKNNIFLINDAFTFNSNADEFYRYIGAW